MPAKIAEVRAFEEGRHRGPDVRDLRIDVFSSYNSRWNAEIVSHVYKELLRDLGRRSLPKRKTELYEKLIQKKIDRIKGVCRAPRPRYLGHGRVETNEEALSRYENDKVRKDTRSRRASRRNNVGTGISYHFHNQLMIIAVMEAAQKDMRDEDRVARPRR